MAATISVFDFLRDESSWTAMTSSRDRRNDRLPPFPASRACFRSEPRLRLFGPHDRVGSRMHGALIRAGISKASYDSARTRLDLARLLNNQQNRPPPLTKVRLSRNRSSGRGWRAVPRRWRQDSSPRPGAVPIDVDRCHRDRTVACDVSLLLSEAG